LLESLEYSPPLPKKYGLNVTRPHPPPIELTELKRFFTLLIFVLTTPADEDEASGLRRLLITFMIVEIPEATNLPAVDTSKLGLKS
jgi:hypothetical protein